MLLVAQACIWSLFLISSRTLPQPSSHVTARIDHPSHIIYFCYSVFASCSPWASCSPCSTYRVLTELQKGEFCSWPKMRQFTNWSLLLLPVPAGWSQRLCSASPGLLFPGLDHVRVMKTNISVSFPALCVSFIAYSRFIFVPIISMGFQCFCHQLSWHLPRSDTSKFALCCDCTVQF